MQKNNIKKLLAEKADLVNDRLKELLEQWSDKVPQRLFEAIEYVLAAGGKRIRAAVVLLCCRLIEGKENDDALNAAAAVEMIHTYSLVHDDLPAMDDDDFRRGKPSCHKAFDEATAILTGDALLTMAFEVIAAKTSSSEKAIEMAKVLAQAAGPAGMIGGQIADIIAENSKPDAQMLEYIHINKTAKMFQASAVLGAIAANANHIQIKDLSRFGLNLGLTFQIADDILDVVSDSKTLGKTAGKDAKQGKITYPAIYGLEESKKKAQVITQKAVENLSSFGDKAEILKKLTLEIIDRVK